MSTLLEGAWVRRVASPAEPPIRPDPNDLAALDALVRAYTHQPSSTQCFRCQATEARRATEPLGTWEPAQYVREINSGNVTIGRFLRVAAHAGSAGIASKLRHLLRMPLVPRAKRVEQSASSLPLGLQPGEWVQVKSADEIMATLDDRLTHRGLLFAPAEMLPACGKRFRVRRRVQRIVDESSGHMPAIKPDCIILDGYVCTGDRSHRRWFCAREIFPYWREAWLQRVEPPR